MKFLKWVFVLLGLAALVTAGVMYYMSWLDLREVRGALRSYNGSLHIPSIKLAYTMLASAVGGLLLGWGIGLPTRTRHGIRNEYKRDLEAQGYHRDEVVEERHNGLLHRDRVARDEVVENREERI